MVDVSDLLHASKNVIETLRKVQYLADDIATELQHAREGVDLEVEIVDTESGETIKQGDIRVKGDSTSLSAYGEQGIEVIVTASPPDYDLGQDLDQEEP